MMPQWRIGIRGRPRKDIDSALLLQAVIALGKQLQSEVSDDHQQCNDGPSVMTNPQFNTDIHPRPTASHNGAD